MREDPLKQEEKFSSLTKKNHQTYFSVVEEIGFFSSQDKSRQTDWLSYLQKRNLRKKNVHAHTHSQMHIRYLSTRGKTFIF